MKKINSNVYILCILSYVLAMRIAAIYCDCDLRIEGSSPLFLKTYGSRKIIFKVFEKSLRVGQNETINAQCSTSSYLLLNFSLRSLKKVIADPNRSAVRSIELYCNMENRVEFKRENDTNFIATDFNSIIMYCTTKVGASMFEATKHKLPNCERYSNYALGVKMPHSEDIVTLGICYDLDKLAMKFVNYVAYQAKEYFAVNKQNVHNPLMIGLESKLEGLNNYFKFMKQESFNQSIAKLRIEKTLLQAFEFDFESIVQDAPLHDDIMNFSYIFNTMWWRQLRQHNWQYFLEALLERSKLQKYIVYVGIHSNISIPSASITRNKFEALEVQWNDVRIVAPAYIWAYLHDADETANESFVVIAHNSPFAQQPSAQILCADMCDKIEWLEKSKFGNLRKIPTLGYAYCCLPQDVSTIIESFPWPQAQSHLQPQSEVQPMPSSSKPQPPQPE